MYNKNFIKLCLDGKVRMSDIDDFIDYWHNSEIDIPLYDYLGMTEYEYNLWITDNTSLPRIIKAHKEGGF